MLNEVFRLSDYLHYLVTAKTRHGVHSPFVYSLLENVIYDKTGSPYFDIIETTRRKMLKSKATIDFVDYGGGKKSGIRNISEIAANTGRNAKYGRLLFRLLNAVKPEFSLELGTGSGIATLYQAAALDSERPLHTIEGSNPLSEIAMFNASQCGLAENIHFHQGTFESKVPEILSALPRIDYAFIDGNHLYEPTLQYFDWIREKAHENTVLVFDDIYWSEEMKMAWAAIRNHPSIRVTIDIFAYGIVFFRNGQEKENFIIRY